MSRNLQFLQTEFPQLADCVPLYIHATVWFMHDKISGYANTCRGVLDVEGYGLVRRSSDLHLADIFMRGHCTEWSPNMLSDN
jgi:hypothetical protein